MGFLRQSIGPSLHETAARKQSLVCLAAGMRSVGELIDLVEEVGLLAALKTHVDIVDDFSIESWQGLIDSAEKEHDLLILFKDRKFADIGKVSQNQMAGFMIFVHGRILLPHTESLDLTSLMELQQVGPTSRG